MSSVSPRPVWKNGVNSSWKPYLYSPIATAAFSSAVSSVRSDF
jgi:hypothetical protein